MVNQRAHGGTSTSTRVDVVIAHTGRDAVLASDLAAGLRRLGVTAELTDADAPDALSASRDVATLLVIWGRSAAGNDVLRSMASSARRSGLLLGLTADGGAAHAGTVGPTPDLTNWSGSVDESVRSLATLIRSASMASPVDGRVVERSELSDAGRLVDFHRDVAERTRLAQAVAELDPRRAEIVASRSFGGPLGRSAGWHIPHGDRAAGVAEPAPGAASEAVLVGSQLIRRSRSIAPLFWREAVSLRSPDGDGWLVSPVVGELQLNIAALERLGLDEPQRREVADVVALSLAAELPDAQVIESTVTHLVLITGDGALRELLDQEPGSSHLLARRADLIRVLGGGNPDGSRSHLIDMFFGGVDPARRIGISPGVSFRSNTIHQDLASGRAGVNAITVVTGAAGTGKSQLAANLVAETISAGGSVLITGPDQASVDLLVERTSLDGRSLVQRVGGPAVDAAFSDDLESLMTWADSPDRRTDLRARWRSLVRSAEPLDRKATQLVDLDAFGTELADGLRAMGEVDDPVPSARESGGAVSRLVTAAREQLAWVRTSMASLGELDDLDLRRTERVGAIRDEIGPPLAFQALRDRVTTLDQAQRSAVREMVALLRTSTLNARRRSTLMAELVGAIPGWACPIDQLARFFGPDTPVVDLIIVDEASAVDMGAALALFGRSRRLLVMGDRDGLRSTSTLTPTCIAQLAERSALPDGVAKAHDPQHTSLLDLGVDAVGRDVIHLEHQHRGAVTGDPFDAPPASVVWVEVPAVPTLSEHARSNRAEADAVVATVRLLVESEQSSVAVLTPFDEQVELVRELLADAGFESIRVGRTDQLRGDERDVIVLSTVLGPGASRSTRRMAGLEDRVHQALTRARERIVVIGDPESALELGGELGRIAESAARIVAGPGTQQVA